MKELFLTFYIIWSIVIALYSISDGATDYSVSIIELYENTDMNILGCALEIIFVILFNPIISVLKLTTNFVYWICHVGRK